MAPGASFQALVESFIKELVALSDFPSINFPLVIDLELLIPVSSSFFLVVYTWFLCSGHCGKIALR